MPAFFLKLFSSIMNDLEYINWKESQEFEPGNNSTIKDLTYMPLKASKYFERKNAFKSMT